MDGGGGSFPVCEEERTVNEWGTADRRPRTADGGGGGFPVCEEEQTVNEWGTNKRMGDGKRQTAEWTAAGEAFQSVRRSRPSTNGERINEWGTADGRPRSGRRRGMLSSLQEDRQNFVTLCLCGLFFSHHEGTRTQ